MLSCLVTLNPLPLTKSLQALTKAAVTKKTLREPGWVRLGLWMSRKRFSKLVLCLSASNLQASLFSAQILQGLSPSWKVTGLLK